MIDRRKHYTMKIGTLGCFSPMDWIMNTVPVCTKIRLYIWNPIEKQIQCNSRPYHSSAIHYYHIWFECTQWDQTPTAPDLRQSDTVEGTALLLWFLGYGALSLSKMLHGQPYNIDVWDLYRWSHNHNTQMWCWNFALNLDKERKNESTHAWFR